MSGLDPFGTPFTFEPPRNSATEVAELFGKLNLGPPSSLLGTKFSDLSASALGSLGSLPRFSVADLAPPRGIAGALEDAGRVAASLSKTLSDVN